MRLAEPHRAIPAGQVGLDTRRSMVQYTAEAVEDAMTPTAAAVLAEVAEAEVVSELMGRPIPEVGVEGFETLAIMALLWEEMVGLESSS